jgi:5-methylcytosine-specific restriction enzyme A
MPENKDFSYSFNADSSDTFDENYHSFSWTIEFGNTAIKKTDRSVFLYRETVIPQKIRGFFDIEDLPPGKKRHIIFWHGTDQFEAFIEKTVHPTPRTRLMWKPDFASLLQTAYPQWLEFFKKSRKESDDTPSIRFIKREEPNQYEIEFSEATSQDGTTELHVPIKPGDIIDNETIRAIFKCSSQGGMRRSLRTNSLVLVSDHTKSFYEDKWINEIFHYTGMGLTGDQSLTFLQNKTLDESPKNGVNLYLFEVFEEGKYVFIGEVELVGTPYIDQQADSEENIRKVYIFPLKVKGSNHPPLLKKELLEKKDESIHKIVHKLSLEELGIRAKFSHKESGRREVISSVRERDQVVSEYAKRKANGICQLCNQPAPFLNRDQEPYLETHHIIPLADDGPDIIENVAALCPNCHRKMHILNSHDDVTILKNKIS